MKNRYLKMALLVAALAAFAWLGLAQNAETAKDPVCGMMVKVDGAKITYEYKGTKYYFCSEGCKAEFSKNPEKYLEKQDVTQPAPGEKPPLRMMHGQPGGAPPQPMMQGQAGCMCSCAMRHGHGGGMPPMAMRHGRAGRMAHAPMMQRMPGGMGSGLMMLPDVERKVENTKDGIVITLTSKNPDIVKKLQEHAAMMKGGPGPMMKSGECPMMKAEAQGKQEKKAGCPMMQDKEGGCAGCAPKK